MLDVDFIFTAGSRYGWTERHVWGDSNRAQAETQAGIYVTARRAALPVKCNLAAVRYSDPDVYRDAQLLTVTGNGPGALVEEAEHPFVALMVRMSDNTTANWKQFYYRGFKDSLTDQDTIVPGAGPDRAAIEAALDALIVDVPAPGWGWFGRDFAQPTRRVAKVTVPTGGPVTLEIAGHGYVEGQKIQIRGERDMVGLNGYHIVASVPDVDTITLPGTVRVIGTYGEKAITQPIVKRHIRYGFRSIVRATKRSTGRPFDIAHGRAKNRKALPQLILAGTS